MNRVRQNRTLQNRNASGFTLLEMIIIMVIVGILATGVVFMFTNPSAKVKGQAFTMLGDLNMARSEAVTRNDDVQFTLLFGATNDDEDGYRIWVDENGNGTYAVADDTLIREVFFPLDVQFYDLNATDGPDKKPFAPWDALDMEDGLGDDDDGVVFDSGSPNDNEVAFTSMGTAINSAGNALGGPGYIIIYFPVSAADHATMRSKPYAVVMLPGAGSVRIARFNKVGDLPDPWRTK